jgi:hypothetical protein
MRRRTQNSGKARNPVVEIRTPNSFAEVEARVEKAIVKTLKELGYSYQGRTTPFIRDRDRIRAMGTALDGSRMPREDEVQDIMNRIVAFVQERPRAYYFWLSFSFRQIHQYKLLDITVKIPQ